MAQTYLDFAAANPVVYELMFVRRSTLRFATDDVPVPLAVAFAELRGGISGVVSDRDVDTLTEVFWAALHGLVVLARSDRLRPDYAADRVRLLVEQFSRH